MRTLRVITLAVCALAPSFAAYQYDYPNLLNPFSGAQWTLNGTHYATNNIFSSTGSGGSAIFNSTVPGPSSTYEVRATVALPVMAPGIYVVYLRASSNANLTVGSQATGTFYAFVMSNPNSSYGQCSATWSLVQSISGTLSYLANGNMLCHDGLVLRAAMLNGRIAIYGDNTLLENYAGGLSITSGQPGLGVGMVYGYSGAGFSKVDIGHYDTVAPSSINSQMVGTSVFGNRVDMQWQGGQDDSNGIGVGFYYVYRDSGYLGFTPNPTFSDLTATPGAHTYTIYVDDYHFNQATGTNL